MRRTTRSIVFIVLVLTALSAVPAVANDADGINWPSFRGARAAGLAEGFPTPTEWSVEDSRNIRWKTAIPGMGHSSPVIWGDRLYVTTAVSGSDDSLKVGLYGNIKPVDDDSVHRWQVVCVDKNDGTILWIRTSHEGVPAVKRHTKATHANSTVATDGKHVVAMFGSEGLYAYDMDGDLLWKKDLGVLDSAFFMVPPAQWGFGSSPVIYDGRVIVQADVLKNSFLAAFDVDDGTEIWRTARDEYPTWSTPTIIEDDGKPLIVVNGFKHIGAYDFATGEEVWKMSGGGDIPVPTPVIGDDLVFITNAHGNLAPVYAVRKGARGEIGLEGDATSNDHIAWSEPRGGAYMQTPLVYGDYLYVCRDNGVLACYEAATGERLYQQRLGAGTTGFTASAVAANGKIYFTSEMGDTHVIKAGPEFELVAEGSVDEITMATPAISEGTIYFRTKGHVVAVADSDSDSAENATNSGE